MNFLRLILLVLLSTSTLFAEDAPQQPPLVEVKTELDVEYIPGGGKMQSFDIYYPVKSEKPLPLIVLVHGGGWRGGDKGGGCPLIPQTQRGYVIACINYRFSNQAIFPAQIQDCQAAIRFFRANAKKYNIDPDHIGVWGDSAGGHLVALLGTAGGSKAFPAIGGNEEQSDRVQAVIDWYGPTDFINFAAQEVPPLDELHSTVANSPISELFGGPVTEHLELARSASPINYVSKDSAPILIEHGDKDSLVPIAQSIDFAAALKQAGADVTFHNIKDAGHGPGIIRDGFLDVVVEFFDKHLK